MALLAAFLPQAPSNSIAAKATPASRIEEEKEDGVCMVGLDS
ncbi:hypothetical protein ACS15_4941 [Ralstonia insidiosa]|uniref:Uncharacterized protein n=1 Tax=Ralstonia insidiosa TaxID=190721 RepID=A0AAC9BLJ3_9RALS|nr:hypothetical protein ACS15_4941 [Ralstonia insidiosa]